MNSPLRYAIALIVCTAALIWPAVYNRQAFFFPDTTAYIRGADAGIQSVFKHKSAWSAPTGGQKSVSSIADKTVLTGRSPYYGALLYLGDLSGAFWLTVALQSLGVAAALCLATRSMRGRFPDEPIVMALVISALSTAPFFVSLLMPDVFAGIAVLVAATLLADHSRLTRSDYGIAWLLLAAAAVFHDSHVLILSAMLALAAGHAILARSAARLAPMVLILTAVLTGIAAQAGFGLMVRHAVGAPPLRPPFLMARSLEDGPGYRYLRATCPANGFKVCAYADRLPLPADEFLWRAGAAGVFASAPPDVRRQLSDEQVRFVREVFAYDPLAQTLASLKDAALQLSTLGLTEFAYTAEEKTSFADKLPADTYRQMQQSAAFTGSLPMSFFDGVIRLAAITAVLVVVAVWSRRRRVLLSANSSVSSLIVWIAAGIVINAAVCGILSGPHDRYSSRVDWLLPLAAVLVFSAARRAHADTSGAAAPASRAA